MVWGQVEVQVELTFDRVSGSTAHIEGSAKVGRPCEGASWNEEQEEEEKEEAVVDVEGKST